MNLTGQHFIGYERSQDGGDSFQASNPVNGQLLQTSFAEATSSEVNQAIRKSEDAFASYTKKTNEERALFLEEIGNEILDLGDALIHRGMAETALPEGRLKGERMRTVNQLRLFAEVVQEGSWVGARIDKAIPDREPFPKSDIRQIQVPLGPVGIFGASNFPLAFSVAGGDTASALAAGCPVIVKGHPLHPGTSELISTAITRAAQKTGMPDGVFSLLQGQTHKVGMAIVEHPLICAIGFTGSLRGGKAIFDAANRRSIPIPVFAEMGSTNPVFILPGALASRGEELASGLVNSVNLGVGQFCTNPGLIIANASDHTSHLFNTMGDHIRNSSPGTMLSEGIKNNYISGVSHLENAPSIARLATSKAIEGQVESNIFQTTGSHFLTHPEFAEEIFGPSTLSVIANDKEEMLEIARQLDGHLTASIHGTEEDLEEYSALIQILTRKVGRLIFNGYPTGVEVCHSMVHGGPFPATTVSQSTSVGTGAIKRFARPVCFQDFPQERLPDELKDENPLKIWRMVDGKMTR